MMTVSDHPAGPGYKAMNIETILDRSRVIPVLSIDDMEAALPLCAALYEGGLPVLEITLRTPLALTAVATVAQALPDAVIGVGTALHPDDLARAAHAGARFAVSPGLDATMLDAADGLNLPYLPGIQTSSEAMAAWRRGVRRLKFFPARAAGGVHALQQLAPLYPGLKFCPTGGIGFEDAPTYLAEPNVACVGGSFVAPRALIESGNWVEITALARRAASL